MRTIEEVQTEMDIVQATFPALVTLDTNSDVGFFPQLKKMWALLVLMFEAKCEEWMADMESRMEANQVGGLVWIVNQVKLFQFGDSLSVVNGRAVYDVVDPEKRIVVQSTVTEDVNTGRLTIRAVRKVGADLTMLIPEELDALKAYVGKIKYAGVVVDVNSLPADQIKLVATVKVDRQVFALTGALLSDNVKFPVKDAITAYLKALPSDSVLSNTALTDVIQSVKGVKDFNITTSATRRPVAIEWTTYTREVISTAGHGVLHNDSVLTYTY